MSATFGSGNFEIIFSDDGSLDGCGDTVRALDLEGVNNVVGEPYKGLSVDTPQWHIAREQAVLEVNAAAEAMFNAGATKDGLWDNHGAGSNVDRTKLDPRIVWCEINWDIPRMGFIAGEYDAICFFGYHTMEGTLGGILAHTMSSKDYQYYKLNGKHIGEFDMDSYIAASHGVPSILFVGGDLTCSQAKRSLPGISTVITKKETGRNSAIFRDNTELLAEIKAEITKAVNNDVALKQLTYPATMEKSFKRTEDAEIYLKTLRENGIKADYLDDEVLIKDAHTVVSTVNNINEFIKSLY
jgi:D-amino peptidase